MGKLVRVLLAAVLLLAVVGLLAEMGTPSRPAAPAAQAGQDQPTLAATTTTSRPPQTAGPAATIIAMAPGTIAFGQTFDGSAMAVRSPAASFSASSPFGWIASFSTPPDALSVQVIVVRAAGAGEAVVASQEEALGNPSSLGYGAQSDPGFLARLGAGSYAMRVYSGTTLLAQGAFTVTP